MRVGVAISKQDPSRVINDIYQELISFHNVELLTHHSFRSPIFYYRIERFLGRYNLSRLMRRNNVVYFEWASDLLANATRLPKTCGIVTRLHRYEMFQWVPKINWDVVDKVILLSKAMQRKFIAQCPQHAHKTVVIPWAISPTKFQFKQHFLTGNIGTMCELVPRKRLYELILVYSEVVKGRNNLNLHIAGDANPMDIDYLDAMKVLLQKFGIEDRVIFDGRISDTPNWFQQIDIFVSNSYSEGLQSALLEAMATGCYGLSHQWDGADEILPSENLFYTDWELFDKLNNYYKLSEEEIMAQSRFMREIVCDKFDLRLTLSQIRDVIENVGLSYS
jgi:glycosyltransferase involved in cell wall biosynthesis